MAHRWTIMPPDGSAFGRRDSAPMLPALVDQVPAGADWIHELKWDGYRIIARKEGQGVRLWSHTGRDWRDVFTGIALAVAALPATSLIIDGEAVVLREDGSADFFALASARARAACLIAFDISRSTGWTSAPRPWRRGATSRGNRARAHLCVIIFERIR